jgi:hypothetical protein
MKRKPKRLLDQLEASKDFLDRNVAKNRRELLKTTSFPGAATKHDPESTVR